MKKCTSAACHTFFFHLCDIGGCTELGTLEQSSLTYLCPSPNVSNDESSSGSNIAILYQLSNQCRQCTFVSVVYLVKHRKNYTDQITQTARFLFLYVLKYFQDCVNFGNCLNFCKFCQKYSYWYVYNYNQTLTKIRLFHKWFLTCMVLVKKFFPVWIPLYLSRNHSSMKSAVAGCTNVLWQKCRIPLFQIYFRIFFVISVLFFI